MARNILIVYYSHSGNTRKLAELIRQKTGGTLCEIQPETAYPASYSAVLDQAKKEIRAGFRPALKTKIEQIEAYDTVIVGSPIWWGTIAPPVAAFLEKYDLSGKNVAPFVTHGGGGSGQTEKGVAKLCPKSTILPVLSVYGGGDAESQVTAWLKQIGLA